MDALALLEGDPQPTAVVAVVDALLFVGDQLVELRKVLEQQLSRLR